MQKVTLFVLTMIAAPDLCYRNITKLTPSLIRPLVLKVFHLRNTNRHQVL